MISSQDADLERRTSKGGGMPFELARRGGW